MRLSKKRLSVESLEARRVMAASLGWDGPGLGSVELTYHIADAPSSMTQEATVNVIERALDVWEEVVDIKFTRTSQPGLEKSLDISFGNIDGEGGALAQAYFPDDVNSPIIAGDILFDSSEVWEDGNDMGPQAFDLLWVAVHEIGHSLGLEHSDDPQSVLRDSVSPNQQFVSLSQSDIDAARRLYAQASPDSSPPATPPTDPPTNEEPNDPPTEPNPPNEPTPPIAPNDKPNDGHDDGPNEQPIAPETPIDDRFFFGGENDGWWYTEFFFKTDVASGQQWFGGNWMDLGQWWSGSWSPDSWWWGEQMEYETPANHHLYSATDVNADGETSPRDVLQVINHLANPTNDGHMSNHSYVDVNADGTVTPLDVLMVINELNKSPSAASAASGIASAKVVSASHSIRADVSAFHDEGAVELASEEFALIMGLTDIADDTAQSFVVSLAYSNLDGTKSHTRSADQDKLSSLDDFFADFGETIGLSRS